jgi:uncharacterized SAM-binding protein YcdF (DUF218 family)
MRRGSGLFLGTAAGAGAVIALLAAASSLSPSHSPPPAIVDADAALVLSGDGSYLRVARAAELYRSGAVPMVIVTGRGIGGDSAEGLRAECIKRGVATERVRMERASTSTRENMLFVAPLVRREGCRRVALVTSAVHMGRAERAARKVMPEVDWVAVPVPDGGPGQRRLRLLEWMKLAWYFARGWV